MPLDSCVVHMLAVPVQSCRGACNHAHRLWHQDACAVVGSRRMTWNTGFRTMLAPLACRTCEHCRCQRQVATATEFAAAGLLQVFCLSERLLLSEMAWLSSR